MIDAFIEAGLTPEWQQRFYCTACEAWPGEPCEGGMVHRERQLASLVGQTVPIEMTLGR